MKILKYLLPAVALLAASCNHDPDQITTPNDTPVIENHGDVVVNDVTVDENFTLVWSAAKFGAAAEVDYTVSAKTSSGSYVELATTRECYHTLTNSALFETLGITLTGDYLVTFKVEARSSRGEKSAAPLDVKFVYTKISYLWMLGAYQDWSGDKPASQLLQGEDGVFRGFLQLPADGEFKITSQPNFDGTNYGAGDIDGTLSSDGDAGNLSAVKGLYYVEADLEKLTYVLLPLTSVSLIGEAVGGWDDDVAMNYNADAKSWTTIANVVEGKEYKIRFNNMWDIPLADATYNCSLGGDAADLELGGGNLISENEGITGFTLSLFTYPYSLKTGEVKDDGKKLYVASKSGEKWNYASAPFLNAIYENDVQTGTYAGVVDLDADTEVLFARMPSEYGIRYGGAIDALVEYAGGAEAQALQMAAGQYYLYADINEGVMKATPVAITSIALVGGLNGWDVTDVTTAPLVLDAATRTWKQTLDIAADGQMKIAFNGMWNTVVGGVTHQLSLGGAAADLRLGGSDFFIPAGEHTFELNFAKSPITLKIDGKIQDFSSAPDFLELTGKFNTFNWNVAGAPASPKLMPYKDKNRFAAFMKTYAPAAETEMEFKLTYPNWSTWIGGTLQTGTTYIFDVANTNGDNMKMPFGLYLWDATYDATAKTGTLNALPMATVGLVGEVGTTAWGSDVLFPADVQGVYTLEAELTGGASFKVRFQKTAGLTDWDYNLGVSTKDKLVAGAETELVPNAAENLVAPAAGTYTVKLDLSKSPNTITITAK